jgi:hypothetical protein
MQKSVWRHLALLSVLAYVLSLWGPLAQFRRDAPDLGWGPALHAAALHALNGGTLTWYLVIAAGIAAGTGALGKHSVRTALLVLAATMLTMIAFDAVIEPMATRANIEAAKAAARSPATAFPSYFNDSVFHNRADTLGELRTGIQLLRDHPPILHKPLGAAWSRDDPRERAAESAISASMLLLPFIGIGLMLGIVTWVRQHVTFRTPRDETAARWVVAWVVVPAVCGFIRDGAFASNWLMGRTNAYWLPLRPYLPFLFIAAVGWLEAARDRGRPSAPAV